MQNYKLISYQIEAEDGLWWVAEFPALKGVVGTARIQFDAIQDLYTQAEAHIAFLKDTHECIPVGDSIQDSPDYSGRLTVRIQKSIHSLIAKKAKEEGVSINQWMTDAILYQLGRYDSFQTLKQK